MMPNLFYLIPAVISLFWAVTIFLGGKRNFRSQNIGGIALLHIAIGFLASFAAGNTSDNYLYYVLDILSHFCILAFLSFMVLYFRTLTYENALKWKDFLILMPALLFACISLFLLGKIAAGTEGVFNLDNHAPFKPGNVSPDKLFLAYFILDRFVYYALVVIQINYLLIYAWVSLNRYKEQLENFFYFPQEKSAEHNHAVFRGLTLTGLLMVFILGSNSFFYYEYQLIHNLSLLLWGGMLFYVGYHISKTYYAVESFAGELAESDAKERNTAAPEGEEDTPENKYWNTNRTKLISRLDEIMDNEKFFLQQNLRLDELARRMNSNRTYVSRLFKEEYDCGFSEYINRKRVEYAQELMRFNPILSQEQLAEKSGFNHPSSFSRAFKQYAGMTFREWQKAGQAHR